jgi:hypothetical protein
LDYLSFVAGGLFSALLGFALGGVSLFALKSRLESKALALIQEFVDDFITEVEEHPNEYAKRVKPFLDKLIEQQYADKVGGKSKSIKIGDFKIPLEALQMISSFMNAGGAKAAGNMLGNVLPG